GNTQPHPSIAARTRLASRATYSGARSLARSPASQSSRWAESGRLRWSAVRSITPARSFSTRFSRSESISRAASLLGLRGALRTRPAASRYFAYHLAAGLRYFAPSFVTG